MRNGRASPEQVAAYSALSDPFWAIRNRARTAVHALFPSSPPRPKKLTKNQRLARNCGWMTPGARAELIERLETEVAVRDAAEAAAREREAVALELEQNLARLVAEAQADMRRADAQARTPLDPRLEAVWNRFCSELAVCGGDEAWLDPAAAESYSARRAAADAVVARARAVEPGWRFASVRGRVWARRGPVNPPGTARARRCL
jgi:hypothetical protein